MAVDKKDSPWDRLPPHTLENIFSYLSPAERAKASTVCRSWAEVYQSPSLWRSPVFKFRKIQTRFNPRRVVQRFGAFFRKLSILHKRPRCNSMKFVSKQISDFLNALTVEGVQVKSLRMARISILTEVGPPVNSYERLTEFLKIQKDLSNVDFTNARAFRRAGLYVLESLPENIEHLKMQNFFEAQFSGITRLERYLEAISRFRSLRSLSINYNYLSDEVLEIMASNLDQRFETFSILCRLSLFLDNILSQIAWSKLMKACPRLQVDFTLEAEGIQTDGLIRSGILLPMIPLEKFHLDFRSLWNNHCDYHFLEYLSQTFPDTLREAQFEIFGFDSCGVENSLIGFASRCYKLEEFTVRAKFPNFNIQMFLEGLIDMIIEKMADGRPSNLKVVRTTFRSLMRDRRRLAATQRRIYVSRFRDLGLVLKFRIKK